MKIEDHFANVVGQSHVKERLIQSVKSAENGGPMANPFLIAPKGNGKSHLRKAYENAMRGIGVTVVAAEPDEFRLEGSKWEEIVKTVHSGERFLISVDEAHWLKEKSTSRQDKFLSFVLKATQAVSWDRPIGFEGQEVIINPRNGSFLFATNFPGKLDSSGALQSRFQKMELSLYSMEQLIEILQLMLDKEGFREVNEKTLSFIARCGRGTCRPMEHIVQELVKKRAADGNKKNTVNREDVLHTLHNCQMFPAGLEAWEVEVLNYAKEKDLTDGMILAMIPKIENSDVRSGKQYLFARGYIDFHGRGIRTSDLGKKYLAEIEKDGFSLVRS
jgi:Holliday junction resolvasome RuvABC ATP-dependent DNA helicase subunit